MNAQIFIAILFFIIAFYSVYFLLKHLMICQILAKTSITPLNTINLFIMDSTFVVILAVMTIFLNFVLGVIIMAGVSLLNFSLGMWFKNENKNGQTVSFKVVSNKYLEKHEE